MSRLKFSTRSLLGAIVVIAVVLAALRSQSQLVANIAYSLNLGLLCVAIVGSMRATPRWRIFWTGFAVFGWVFLWESTARQSPDIWWVAPFAMQSPDGAELLTTTFLRSVDGFLASQPAIGQKVMAEWTTGSYFPGTVTSVQSGQFLIKWADGTPPQWRTISQVSPNNQYATQMGHFILGPIIALTGGLLSRLLFAPPFWRHRDESAGKEHDQDSDSATTHRRDGSSRKEQNPA